MFDVRVDLKRLEDRIEKFEEQPIETGQILFYGDSSFTRWGPRHGNRPLAEDICMKDGSPAAINHGFGTSTAEEQLYFYDRAVRPWKPRALVLQTFGNDHGLGYSPMEIVNLYARLCAYARHDMPGIKLYLCNIRPLITYTENPVSIELVKEYNSLLKAYCERHDDCIYVDHTKSPLFYDSPEDMGGYEKIREDVFIEDKVHYNQKGYDLYKEFFLEVLDDIL